MGKNRYYLIARSKNNDDVKAINEDLLKSSHELIDIDMFTTKFKTKGELITFLLENGFIKDFDYDLYIISRNGDNMHALEPIYSNGAPQELFSEIMQSEKKEKIDSKKVEKYLDDYTEAMFYNKDFFLFNIYGFTDIYNKFLNIFKRNTNLSTLKSLKYREGSWALSSYPLVRSIRESYSRYQKYGPIKINDRKRMYQKLDEEREIAKEALFRITDKNYLPGQRSFFDEEAEPVDKLQTILETIPTMNKQIFIDDEINSNYFNYYEDRYYQNAITSLLPPTIKSLLKQYLYFKDTTEINNLEVIKKQLLNELKSSDISLDYTYFFILLYNKCVKDNEMSDNYGGKTKRKNN